MKQIWQIYIEEGDCGTEEMGLLFSFKILLRCWSNNSQGFSLMACTVGWTTRGQPKSQRLYNPVLSMV